MALSDGLTGAPENQYGAEHKEHSIEIYKLYVEIADRISARRQSANSFFVSVNTAIVAFLGLLKSESVDGLTASAVWIIAFAGAALCYLWYRIVRSYRDLNSGKFKVIHEMERRLPLRPYDAEWSALGAGKDSALYLPVSHVEIVVPWIFAAIYVIALILTSRSTAGFEPSTAAIALETGGLASGFAGTVLVALSFGRNLEEAHQIDARGRKVYIASFLRPRLFWVGLALVAVGFIVQASPKASALYWRLAGT